MAEQEKETELSLSQKEKKDREERYQRNNDKLLTSATNNQANLDKYLLTLSSAALGVSLKVTSDIKSPSLPWLAIVSFLCMLITVGCVLTSYYFATLGIRELIRRNKVMLNTGKLDDSPIKEVKRNDKLQFIASLTFGLGILAFMIFVSVNIDWGAESVSEEKKSVDIRTNDASKYIVNRAEVIQPNGLESGPDIVHGAEIPPSLEAPLETPPAPPVQKPTESNQAPESGEGD